MDEPITFRVDGFADYTVETLETPSGFLLFCGFYVGAGCVLLMALSCWPSNPENKKSSEQAARAVATEDTTSGNGGGGGMEAAMMDREVATQEMVPILSSKNNRVANGGGASHQHGQQPDMGDDHIQPPAPFNNSKVVGRNGTAAAAAAAASASITTVSQWERKPEESASSPVIHDFDDPILFAGGREGQRRLETPSSDRISAVPSNASAATTSRLFTTSTPVNGAANGGNNNNNNSGGGGGGGTGGGGRARGAANTSRRRQQSQQSSAGSSGLGGSATAAAGPTHHPLRSWDLTSVGLNKNRTPLRVGSIQRKVQAERMHASSSEDGSSHASRSRSSWNSRAGSRVPPSQRGLSEKARAKLESETVEGEAEFYRNRYIQRSSRRNRGPASLSGSDRTHLPPLSPDALSPNDAADAHDPGTLNVFQAPPPGVGDRLLGCCDLDMKGVGGPDFETKRLLTLAIPTTIAAVAEPFFRIILVAMISHFIDTNSMIAFVFVLLFLRVTTVELSSAIIDAESTMLQDALSLGNDPGFVIAGQRLQLAVIMQLLLTVPILVAWVFGIDNIVLWLTPETPQMAVLARQYTEIIVIDFALQAASRAFMLVFHLTGHARFEINVDLCATALTIIIIAVAVGVVAEPTLVLIGWIQVVIGILKVLAKIYYVVMQGWLKPYSPGIFGGFSLLNKGAVLTFLSLVFPLLLGSLIELREWEILLLFVRHLGGAEVSTWALMGLIWEVFEASTEGLGESGAVRVSYYLAEGLPDLAMMLTSKTIFLAMVQSLTLTAIFLMAGPNISVALTNDATLQHLFNDLVGMVGLANIAMSFTQIYWSLLGAQGRFGLASCCILICRWVLTMPIAAACVYGPSYDARSAAGAVAVGYATAAISLSIFVYRTDWNQAVLDAQEEVTPMDEGVDLDDSDNDEEESEDDSSTGFG